MNNLKSEIQLDEIDLYVTMECNLNCNFCSVRSNEYGSSHLSLKQIFDLISEAKELGMENLHLTGGEPTLRDDLEKIIKYASKKNVKTRLITNGILLDQKRLHKLHKAGLANIMVSIDGLQDTHNLMRGSSNSWQKAMNCVKIAKKIGMFTRISSVVFKNNLKEIPLLMEIAANIGVNIFSIFLGSPLGRGNSYKDQVITPINWKNFIEDLKKEINNSKYGSEMEIIAEQGFLWDSIQSPDFKNIKGRGTGCSTLLLNYDYLIIRSDGNIYQCVFFIHDGMPIGNIKKQSLTDAILHAKKEGYYKSFTELNKKCYPCEYKNLCNGGCRGYSYIYTEDWTSPDPRCSLKLDSIKTGSNLSRYFPLCPIAKLNLRTGIIGGSSDQAISNT